MNARKKFKKLLTELNALQYAPLFAAQASNNRTEILNELTEAEAEKGYAKQSVFTYEYLIDGIYSLCSDLEIIYTKEKGLVNDTLIISYCKWHFSDFMKLHDKPRLQEIDWVALGLLAEKLGGHYLERFGGLN